MGHPGQRDRESIDRGELTVARHGDQSRQDGSTEETYAYAMSNPQIIKWMPCYCGCGGMGVITATSTAT